MIKGQLIEFVEVFYRVAEINPVYSKLPPDDRPGPGWIYVSNEIFDFDIVGEIALKTHSRGYKTRIDEITRITSPDGNVNLFARELPLEICGSDGKGTKKRQ